MVGARAPPGPERAPAPQRRRASPGAPPRPAPRRAWRRPPPRRPPAAPPGPRRPPAAGARGTCCFAECKPMQACACQPETCPCAHRLAPLRGAPRPPPPAKRPRGSGRRPAPQRLARPHPLRAPDLAPPSLSCAQGAPPVSYTHLAGGQTSMACTQCPDNWYSPGASAGDRFPSACAQCPDTARGAVQYELVKVPLASALDCRESSIRARVVVSVCVCVCVCACARVCCGAGGRAAAAKRRRAFVCLGALGPARRREGPAGERARLP